MANGTKLVATPPDTVARTDPTTIVTEPVRLLEMTRHELQNRLSGILSASQFLLSENIDLDAEQVALLRSVESSCNSLRRLLDDLLDYSTVHCGTLKLERKSSSVFKLIKAMLLLSRSHTNARDIRVNVALEKGSPRLYLDSPRMSFALAKLVGCLAESCDPGSEIAIRIGMNRKWTFVDITPEEPGALEVLETIRNSAERRTIETGPNIASTTLALAIVQRVVLAHGGTLQIRKYRHTVTVTLCLPHTSETSTATRKHTISEPRTRRPVRAR